MPHSKIPIHLRTNARRMRKNMTDAERKLWNELRVHRLMGLSFRRQVPLGPYIVDFCCAEHRLIVEVDGSQHGNITDQIYDRERTIWLEAQGWTVIRFWNDEILYNINAVCDGIIRTIGVEKFV